MRGCAQPLYIAIYVESKFGGQLDYISEPLISGTFLQRSIEDHTSSAEYKLCWTATSLLFPSSPHVAHQDQSRHTV